MEMATMALFGMITDFMETNITMFIVTMVFILLDIISGVVVALITGTFSTSMLRKGLGHKLGYVFIMCGVAVLQVAMFDPNFTVGFDFPLFDVVCAFIIFMEFASVIENACKVNPNLKKLFEKYLHLDENKEQEKEDEFDLELHFDPSEIYTVPAEFADCVPTYETSVKGDSEKH